MHSNNNSVNNFPLEKMLKRRLFHLKRHMPRCYLLSSKFILSLATIQAVYFLLMDIKLFIRVKNRVPLTAYLRSSIKINSTVNSLNSYSSGSSSSFSSTPPPPPVNNAGIFWPLPVKKIMMAEGTHFIRSPLAEFVEFLGFSSIFPFISPNLISLTHCTLSVVCVKFLISDSLFWRQFGVCVFQFRNFLDSFDGVVYRAHANRYNYKSHYGSLGYYVDALSDIFGGLCLTSSVAIYLLKHRPLKMSLTRCFRLAGDDLLIEDALKSETRSTAVGLNDPVKNASLSNKQQYSKGHFLSNRFRDEHLSPIFASKAAILTSVALLGTRYALSGFFWDRSVHAYEDLLDSIPRSELHQVK